MKEQENLDIQFDLNKKPLYDITDIEKNASSSLSLSIN